MENSCQVFISYRREGGEILALMLFEKLSQRGYDVFYDHDGLSSGPFEETLYKRIDECTDFLVVLSPGGLDRCADPADWVRNEISYAIKANKNIIPIMIRGFSFEDVDLPEDLIPLKAYNGIKANIEHFPSVFEKLTQKLMHSRPRRKALINKKQKSNDIDFIKVVFLYAVPLLFLYARYFYTETPFLPDLVNELFEACKMSTPLGFYIILFGYCAFTDWLFNSPARYKRRLERSFSLRALKLTDLELNINEFVTLLMEKDNFGEWEITADLIDPDDSKYIWSAKRKGAIIRSFGNIHPDYLCFEFTDGAGYDGRLRPLNLERDVSINYAATLLSEQGFNLVWQIESTACYKNGEWKLLLYFYGISKKVLVMELMKGERESLFEQIVEEAKKSTFVGGVKEMIRKKER